MRKLMICHSPELDEYTIYLTRTGATNPHFIDWAFLCNCGEHTQGRAKAELTVELLKILLQIETVEYEQE